MTTLRHSSGAWLANRLDEFSAAVRQGAEAAMVVHGRHTAIVTAIAATRNIIEPPARAAKMNLCVPLLATAGETMPNLALQLARPTVMVLSVE